MFKLHYTLLLLSMEVFPHMAESGMPRDTTVKLATVLNSVNVLESGLHSTMSALQTNMDDLAATKTELQNTKTELQTTMDDLAATKTELQTTKTRLQDQEGHSSSMNKTLNTIMAQLQETNSPLKEQEQHSSSMNRTLNTTMTQLQETNSRLQDQEGHSSAMNRSLNVQQQQQQHCSSSLNALKTELALKTKNVAFNVYFTSSGTITHRVPVKFGSVQYNTGNGYATSTGKFTAPVSGTYIFSTELVVSNGPLSTYIRILHSGNAVSSGFGRLTPDNPDITTIIHVRAGEQVWVDSTSDVYLYLGYSASHFVGALLSPD